MVRLTLVAPTVLFALQGVHALSAIVEVYG